MSDLMLVTGATGLVGGHVVEEARRRGIPVRGLVRSGGDARLLTECGAQVAVGDLSAPDSLKAAAEGVGVIAHCAAKVGDWGPIDGYRQVNVRGLEALLDAARTAGTLTRFIHISSLGVYPARDHHGTDESEPVSATGIDGYTLTKVEAEQLVLRRVQETGLPATVLRPGFIYGPRDRTVLPRLLERLKSKKFAYLGAGDKLMNNTYVGNLVDAVFLALDRPESIGRVYNITDGRLATKKEFVGTIARLAGLPEPTRHVPLPVARALASVLESTWRLLGKKEAPILSGARIKFLGLNLDFGIERARRELGYSPRVDFVEAMERTMAWFRQQGLA